MSTDPVPSVPARSGGPRYSRAQRRLLTAAAGLVVAALAAGAFALTYDTLRDLAVAGRVDDRWAPVYPAMADALIAVTLLSLVVTRGARWWTRLLRWGLLLLLAAGLAALAVQDAVWGLDALPGDPVRAGVAVAPHVILVLAVWLWLAMFKQIRVGRPELDPERRAPGPRGGDPVERRQPPGPVPDADERGHVPGQPRDRHGGRPRLVGARRQHHVHRHRPHPRLAARPVQGARQRVRPRVGDHREVEQVLGLQMAPQLPEPRHRAPQPPHRRPPRPRPVRAQRLARRHPARVERGVVDEPLEHHARPLPRSRPRMRGRPGPAPDRRRGRARRGATSSCLPSTSVGSRAGPGRGNCSGSCSAAGSSVHAGS
ncbi:DUF2637 domain-containing protein [Actinomadura sp. WAC 06369]|uniref:DUF2637 domain-containing protein n=1 Tax=Actinomadura sp. WAC 06369 TaxID=2203193 RepID=UPI0013159403|nr:DUF2637 domain-containing protein [Actinomadura sp. WAC 06369]